MAIISDSIIRTSGYSGGVIALEDGRWLEGYTSYSDDAYKITYTVRDESGTAIPGTTTVVNGGETSTAGSYFSQTPATAALEGGGWALSWQYYNTDDNTVQYKIQAFDQYGTALLDAPLTLNGVTYDYYYYYYAARSTITALDGGGWVVTWAAQQTANSSYSDVYQQAFHADGSTYGSVQTVNSFTTYGQTSAVTTALENGGWVVTWLSEYQDGSGYGVYQQAYGADGVALAKGEQRVNTSTYNNQTGQQVTALPDGGWVVTWLSAHVGNTSIYQQVYSADGTPSETGEQRVNTHTADTKSAQKITVLDDGGWVVTWVSSGQDGSGSGIYQQSFGPDGLPRNGGEALVNTTTYSNQSAPVVAAIGNGAWVVVWQDASGGGSRIFQQVFNAHGEPIGEETIVSNHPTDGAYGTAPKIVLLGTGEWTVAWSGTYYGYSRSFELIGTAPEGTDQTITFNEDGTHHFTVADFGFSDLDSDDLVSVVITNVPANGLLTLNGVAVASGQSIAAADIGSLQWTPAPNANGNGLATLTFNLVDDGDTSFGGSTTSLAHTLTFNVNPVDDLPVAIDDAVTMEEGTTLVFDPLANDLEYDGEALTVSNLMSLSEYGEVSINEDGKLVINYTGPDLAAGETATLKFVYHAGDGHSKDPAYVVVTVNGVAEDDDDDNNAPTGQDSWVQMLEDRPITLGAHRFGFSDTDGHGLKAIIITELPGSGSLTLDGVAVSLNQEIAAADLGKLVWTPPANGYGYELASLSFKVVDDGGTTQGGSDTASGSNMLWFDVAQVNVAPITAADTATMDEGSTKIVDVLANDGNGDPAGLSVSLASVTSNNGQVSVTDDGKLSVVYTGRDLAVGETATISVTYFAYNGDHTTPGQATITVHGVAEDDDDDNNAPTASNSRIVVQEDGAVTLTASRFGFSDVDGHGLKAVIITAVPETGSLRLNGVAVTIDQQIAAADLSRLVWTPPANAHGDELAALSFKVVDNGGTVQGGADTSAQANTIIFDVASVNDAPVVVNDTAIMNEGSTLLVDALLNDSDADGDTLSISTVSVASNNATVTITEDGKLSITYTGVDLDPGQTAKVSLVYFATDGFSSNPGLVEVTVNGVREDGDPITGTKTADKIVGTEFGEYIYGLAGKDTINGGLGDDFINGGRGADRLIGGGGVDTFIFGPKSGKDTITDFTRSGAEADIIDLTAVAGIADFEDLVSNHLKKSGKLDTLIVLDADSSILVKGVKVGQFVEDHFAF
jgi:hypothetical protein